jgi:hypothetical protein
VYAHIEPLPLVPATWTAFQGNWTFWRRRAMRSSPGWIMARVSERSRCACGSRQRQGGEDVLKRRVTAFCRRRCVDNSGGRGRSLASWATETASGARAPLPRHVTAAALGRQRASNKRTQPNNTARARQPATSIPPADLVRCRLVSSRRPRCRPLRAT